MRDWQQAPERVREELATSTFRESTLSARSRGRGELPESADQRNRRNLRSGSAIPPDGRWPITSLPEFPENPAPVPGPDGCKRSSNLWSRIRSVQGKPRLENSWD